MSQIHLISDNSMSTVIVRLWFYKKTIDKSEYQGEAVLDAMPRLFRFHIVSDYPFLFSHMAKLRSSL